MYICIYVYMYICIFVYMYICIHVYMYTCIHVYMYTCIYVYMYICKYVYMYISIYVYMYICIYVHLYICICICICTVFLYVHVHIRLKMTNLFTFPWNMRGCGGHLRLTFFLTLFLFERFRFKDFYGFRFMHFWVCKFPGFEVKLNFIFDTLGDSNSQSFGPQSSWNLGLAVHIFYNAYGLRFICSWTWRFIGLWGLYMFKHFLAFRLNFFGFKIELSRLQIPGWHFCLEPKGLSLVRAIRMKVWKFKYVYQILLTYWDHGGFSQPCWIFTAMFKKHRFGSQAAFCRMRPGKFHCFFPLIF